MTTLPTAAATLVLRSKVILSARTTLSFCHASTLPDAVTVALSRSYCTWSAVKVTGSLGESVCEGDAPALAAMPPSCALRRIGRQKGRRTEANSAGHQGRAE